MLPITPTMLRFRITGSRHSMWGRWDFSYWRDAAVDSEEIVIAKAGVPLARLVRMEEPRVMRRFAGLEGRIRIADDLDAPLADDVPAGCEGSLCACSSIRTSISGLASMIPVCPRRRAGVYYFRRLHSSLARPPPTMPVIECWIECRQPYCHSSCRWFLANRPGK